MTWVKLDDAFFTNPKAIKAGRNGRSLFLAGLCYASAGLTDGRIDKTALPVLLAHADVPRATVKTLTEIGWWDDYGDHWQIHQYLDYQVSASAATAHREKERVKKANAREKASRAVDGTFSHIEPKSTAMSPQMSPGDRPGDSPGDSPGESHRTQSQSQSYSYLHPNQTHGCKPSRSETGGNKQKPSETLANQALALIADHETATGNARNPDAYRTKILQRITNDGTLDKLKNLAGNNPNIDAKTLAGLATQPPTTQPVHPAIHAQNRRKCDCTNGWIEDDNGATPCTKCATKAAS